MEGVWGAPSAIFLNRLQRIDCGSSLKVWCNSVVNSSGPGFFFKLEVILLLFQSRCCLLGVLTSLFGFDGLTVTKSYPFLLGVLADCSTAF